MAPPDTTWRLVVFGDERNDAGLHGLAVHRHRARERITARPSVITSTAGNKANECRRQIENPLVRTYHALVPRASFNMA